MFISGLIKKTSQTQADVSWILSGFEHRLLSSRTSPQATSSSELTQLILVERESEMLRLGRVVSPA